MLKDSFGRTFPYIRMSITDVCNFKCGYCLPNGYQKDKSDNRTFLAAEEIERLAKGLSELGVCKIRLTGGEPTVRKDFFDIIKTIKENSGIKKTVITTNGYHLDKEMAEKLAKYKVSRVSVSIDSMDEKIHDEIRGRKESWKRAIEGLKHVKNAGMDPYLNITVGHYNANTEHFKQLLDYSKDNNYKTLLNVAVPSGMWQKMTDIICDEKDREYLKKIRKEYKNLVRNIWNPFDKNHEKILGCTTVNRLYVTPIGDVLVCPYVHIKIGNIFESTLKEIVDYGFSIKYFRNHSDLCLAGEDKEFIKKFMTKSGQTIFKPALAKDIFSQEDFIK